MTKKNLQLQVLSDEGKILSKYYWLHRLCRVSKIHKFACLRYKDVEDIAYFNKIPSLDELGKIIAGMRAIKVTLEKGIDKCIKELEDLYGRRQRKNC